MELTYNDLKTEVSETMEDNSKLMLITLSGRINSQSWKDYYDSIFLRVVEEVENSSPENIEISVDKVEMCNSSGIMSLFQWFKKLTTEEMLSKTKIRILYSKNIEWQNSALLTLFKGFSGKISYESI